MESPLTNITHVIQFSVAPVFLLTAVAALISALNLRLNRIIDRRRIVLEQLRSLPGEVTELNPDLQALNQRGRLIYFAIFSSVLSALLVCLVIASAFLGAMLSVELAEVVAGLFVLTMLFMIVAWSLLLREIYLAVRTGIGQQR